MAAFPRSFPGFLDIVAKKVLPLAEHLSPVRFANSNDSLLELVRVEKFLLIMRYVVAFVSLPIVPFISNEQTLQVYTIIGVFLLENVVRQFFIIPYKPHWFKGGYLPFALECGYIAVAIAISGGSSSIFSIIYFPLVAIHSLRFGHLQLVYGPLVSTVSYAIGIALSGEPLIANLGVIIWRVFWMTVLAFVITLVVERGRLAESRLAHELQRVRALLQASRAPTTSLSVDGVVDAILEQSKRLTGAESVALYLYGNFGEAGLYRDHIESSPAGEAFRRLVRSNFRARQYLLNADRPVTPQELAAAVPHVPEALQTFKELCCVAIPGSPRSDWGGVSEGEENDGRKMGFVVVACRNGEETAAVHRETLVAFLARAALALHNARLYEQLQQRVNELRDLRSQVVRTERLAALGELAAKVAHELNNPLASIQMYSSLLQDQPVEPDEQQRIGAVLSEQVARAQRVVRDILEFSRPQEPQREPMNINAAVEYGLRLVRHAAEMAKVTLIEDYGGRLPPVLVDKNQMAQVVINIVLNAIQAMPQGGTLTVTTGVKNDEVYVCFTDTGMGIAPEHLERVFEPFFTTKPQAEGTGLGLAICRGIIAQHRGRITVESELGRGSVFTVWLPPAPTLLEEEKSGRPRRR